MEKKGKKAFFKDNKFLKKLFKIFIANFLLFVFRRRIVKISTKLLNQTKQLL